jgi:hypothetical protein
MGGSTSLAERGRERQGLRFCGKLTTALLQSMSWMGASFQGIDICRQFCDLPDPRLVAFAQHRQGNVADRFDNTFRYDLAGGFSVKGSTDDGKAAPSGAAFLFAIVFAGRGNGLQTSGHQRSRSYTACSPSACPTRLETCHHPARLLAACKTGHDNAAASWPHQTMSRTHGVPARARSVRLRPTVNVEMGSDRLRPQSESTEAAE